MESFSRALNETPDVCSPSRLFEPSDLVGDAAQVIHVVVAVLQAAFLVGVDLEPLAAARGFGGQRLPLQIDRETGRGIVVYGGEDRCEEVVAHRDRQQTVVEGVVAEDVGEETRHHDAEAVVGDGPCGVFARTAAPEVAACDQYAAPVGLSLSGNEATFRPSAS